MDQRHKAVADLENKRGLFFRIGMIVSLGLVMLAFDWKSRYAPGIPDEPLDEPDWEYTQGVIVYPEKEKPAAPKVSRSTVVPVSPLPPRKVPDYRTIEPAPVIPKPPAVLPGPPAPDHNVPLLIADVMPKFMDGQASLDAYIRNHITYSSGAVRAGVEGTVFVTFVVDTSGHVTDVQLRKGIHIDLDREAMRVLKSMPRWKPGRTNGYPVAVRQTMPIKFKLKRY